MLGNRTVFLFFGLFIYQFSIAAAEVFGCGGFVKSDVEINYSLVEVKLYTPHGSIKYQTDCAPNTGYYLIPLYDKGDYTLKTHPPKGWGFEPERVTLKVDGETDQCSQGQDINFKFTGFSVYGQVVSAGQLSGPAGVDLQLTSTTSAHVIATTTTGEDGSFSFSNVMPGDLLIKASHKTWQFEKNEVAVTVKNDNAQVGPAITIAGYDVSGAVTGDGQPMKSVNFVLFSEKAPTKPILQCQPGAPKAFQTKETTLSPICHVTSGDDGRFVFPVVPSGSYFLVAYYKGEHITFDVEPEKLDFTVEHNSLDLGNKFEVAGFSVNGKVLDKENGVGIPSVTILINNKEQTVSGEDGSFTLENMKTGTYGLSGRGKHMSFDAMTVEITPKTPQVPSLIVAGFSMCGKVQIDRVPESLGKISTQRRIIYYPEGKGSEAKSIMTDNNGEFCQTVQAGKYIVKVPMSEVETGAGLSLIPAEQVVQVTSRPVLDVSFTQFRARVSGNIRCMETCHDMEVTLDPTERSGSQVRVEAKVSGNQASFAFDNVMPGKYKAHIVMDSWCWKERSLDFEVTNSDLSGLDFSHTGFILKCSVSHPITMNFAHNKKEASVGSFLLDRGLNRFCLAQPGVYQLTPDSCHKFEQQNYSYDTSNPLTLTLTAIQHLALGSVSTEVPADVTVTITSSVDDTPTVLGPLKASNAEATSKTETKEKAKGKDNVEEKDSAVPKETLYEFAHWSRSGETLTISATSSDLLFYPQSVQVFVSGDSCPGVVAELKGRKGVFVEGSIQPPLEGVRVTVSATDGSIEEINIVTTGQGNYKVGPLHADRQYSVTAEKEGYVMSEVKDNPMSFQAFKLGEISVQMLDEEGRPLSAVLLSLSGERQYRSNNVTGADGHMAFLGLSPGQYFLRPMMKEYKFDPVSQVIHVQEGTTEEIIIKGARVAFSCFGRVTSLNGEPEPGVIVEALGQEEGCQGYQEESKTEMDGSYRLRGLQPKCRYSVHLKNVEVNAHIDRMLPASRIVMLESSDLTDQNIVALRRMNHLDISGNFKTTNPKFLSSLKVRLISESQPDSPIHTISMSKSTFFFFPTLTKDNKTYIISVESSLSRFEYDYKLPSAEFTADFSYRHFTFDFNPTLKSVDAELNQGSYLIVPLVALVVALLYNHKTVLPYVMAVYQQISAAKSQQGFHGKPGSAAASSSSSSASQSAADASIPAEFLPGGEMSPVKKRAKPRKV